MMKKGADTINFKSVSKYIKLPQDLYNSQCFVALLSCFLSHTFVDFLPSANIRLRMIYKKLQVCLVIQKGCFIVRIHIAYRVERKKYNNSTFQMKEKNTTT